MSPILVRPVREQFEHDRVIRLLQSRWRRRFDVAVNVGKELTAPLRFGPRTLFPDLILTTNDRAQRLHSIVEVETNESVNHLEAMAQWAHFARVRAAFQLYVPGGAVDTTRRLCAEKKVGIGEIWSYHVVGAELRFTLVYRAPADSTAGRRSTTARKAVAKKAASKKKPGATAGRRKPARRSATKSKPARGRTSSRKPARTKRQTRK